MKKVLYSDIPRPYDEEAERRIKRIGFTLLVLFLIAVCLIASSL